jgi:tetratricopeptide (TPR) repeat protein
MLSGRFAADADWQRLGLSFRQTGWALKFLRPAREAIPPSERALAIFRRLADANPTVTAYKIEVAGCLSYVASACVGYNGAKARDYALESLSVIRSLPPEQQAQRDRAAAFNEMILGEYYQRAGRMEDALAHLRRSVALAEDVGRANPDFQRYRDQIGMFLMNLAGTELIAGDAEGARRTAGRIRDHVEPLLREHPDLRYPWNYKITALLIEAYLNLRAGRVSEASRVAELAAAGFQALKAPLSNQEHASLGCIEALFFATGRQLAADRPAESAGLRHHAERASSEILEAHRMGYQVPAVTAIVDGLLGGRPELRLLLMDQVFPEDPFQPEPGAHDDEPDSETRGTKP